MANPELEAFVATEMGNEGSMMKERMMANNKRMTAYMFMFKE